MNTLARIVAPIMNRHGPREKLAALEGRSFALGLRRGGLIAFTVRDGHILAARADSHPDALLRARLGAYLAIWLGRFDPDAAFFQRRIELDGSLKTAVIVKNVFDGLLR